MAKSKPVKKAKNVLHFFIFMVVLLVVAAVFGVMVYANGMVKWGIESAGSKTLGVDVSLRSADLSLLGGKLGLNDLVVKNPEGYDHENFLSLKKGNISIETGSLFSDTVKIKEILLDNISVSVEQKDIRGNNIQDILKNIPKSEKQDTGKAGKKVVVELLELTNVEVKVKLLPIAGAGASTVDLAIPKITMKNIGGGETEVNTGELIAQIITAIADAIAKNGGGIIPEEMLGTINDALGDIEALKDVLGEAQKQIEGLGEGVEDAGKELEEGLKGVTEGLGGLFGEKKD